MNQKENVSAADLAIIEQQLGRPPRGIVGVAHRSADGVPVVLQMRSLVDGKPFPTLYWLSSRDLYRAIGRIETYGWVKQVEQRLQEDEALRKRYLENHRAYVERRWQLMDEDDKRRIASLGFSELFNRYGIGGISQWDKVRCLHMQFAHYLACGGANVIGELMEREFGLSRIRIEL